MSQQFAPQHCQYLNGSYHQPCSKVIGCQMLNVSLCDYVEESHTPRSRAALQTKVVRVHDDDRNNPGYRDDIHKPGGPLPASSLSPQADVAHDALGSPRHRLKSLGTGRIAASFAKALQPLRDDWSGKLSPYIFYVQEHMPAPHHGCSISFWLGPLTYLIEVSWKSK